MTNLSNQRRMVAAVAGCGEYRIWLDPQKLTEIEAAISRDDIRTLLTNGTIKILQKRGCSRGRSNSRKVKRAYGHCKGPGKRKGAIGARFPRKRQWIQRIRALRRSLHQMREEGAIDRHTYRLLYRKAAGGEFRSVVHLKAHAQLMHKKVL